MSKGDEEAKMGSTGQSDIFDVRKIRRLVELMNDHDLNEIDLRQNEQRIRLRRGADPVVITGPAPVASAPVAPAATAADATVASPPAEEADALYIKSPMVGTFYTAANPESAAYVKIGDAVGPDTTVCIIEAMKVFNEIPAECSGKIVAAMVENGDPVEFGQPLFKIVAG